MAMEKLPEPWPAEVPLKKGDLVIVVAGDPEKDMFPGDIFRLTDRGFCGCWCATTIGVRLPDGRPCGNRHQAVSAFVGTGREDRRCNADAGTKIRKAPW